ncbi:hypothetical protein R1flu_003109 [Riccia fluitans]|uniref:Uncharacterized protein n=1 Tax=Riccia fluitans TaxID=41844 RepID=A0ABD1Y819_9MARC
MCLSRGLPGNDQGTLDRDNFGAASLMAKQTGRFKSCRRSASDLFLKEEDQPPELPEMTPLRWKSSSSKSLSTQAQNSGEQSDAGQSSLGRSTASSAEQTASQAAPTSDLSSVPTGRSLPEALPLPGIPVKNDDISPKDQDTVRTETVTPEAPKAHSLPINGTKTEGPVETSPAFKEEPPEEIIQFQPVDLDQKYRQKELMKHITAAKIQNREESLLNNPSLPIQEARKAPAGDEPAAMTIDFLRARLLAERQASKATKQQMTQLTKKVADLEARLAAEVELRLAEVELRKKAEVALQEALVKLNQKLVHGEVVKDTSAPSSTKSESVENGTTKVDDETTAEPKPDIDTESSNKTVLREEKGDLTPANDSAATARAPLAVSSGSESGSKSSRTSDSESMTETDSDSPNQSKKRVETRTAIEERLRSMWSQLGQEMAALAEVKGDDDKQELMGWMKQVPKVLQSNQLDSGKSFAGKKLGVILPEASLNIVKKPVEANLEEGPKHATNVTILVEQDDAHETANHQAQQTTAKEEDELPALVTPKGDVILENGAKIHDDKPGITPPVVITEEQANGQHPSSVSKSKSVNGSSQAETHISKSKSFDSSVKPRSRTKSFDLSSDSTAGNPSRRASFSGRIEIIDDQPANKGVTDELIDDEDAEELPNGIYLHHSKDDDTSYQRSTGNLYGRTADRFPGTRGFVSPGSRSDRGRQSNGYNSPGSRSDRGSSRERFPSAGGPADGVGEMDWSFREVKDRASRDIYYTPVMSTKIARGDAGLYMHSRTERPSDEALYRGGPGSRWDPQVADPSWVQKHEERRTSDPNQSHSSSEDGSGIPHASDRDIRGTYSYPDRDLLDHDMQYRNTFRQRGEFGPRGDYYRSMPPWQDFDNPGMMRSRSVGAQRPYGYPPPFSVDEPYMAQNIDAAGYSNYHNRSEMFYAPPAAMNRADYHPHYGMPGSRSASMNGYSVPPDQLPVNRGYPTWEAGPLQQERSAAVVPTEDGPGEAGEVLKALRIAKQQIKSSTGEQQAYMTAQYTVSSEHRYGGGQVSKTSYTVEAPVGYAPRVTKTIHEGWLLEGKPKRLGVDGSTPQITDMNTAAGPLAVTNEESSYVEKLNVGRGIQFFFS